MKITMKYDQGVKKEERVTLEIPERELKSMIENDYQQRLATAPPDEVVSKRTHVEIMEEWNRLEYNAWRKHYRYIETSISTSQKEGEEERSSIDVIDLLPDHSDVKEHQRRADYREICQQIHQVLKPAQAEMMIAICLDGLTVQDYARQIEDTPKHVSDRFNYAKQRLKENLTQKINESL